MTNADNIVYPQKIIRPRAQDAIPRQRLFKVIDKSLSKPILWVSSPAGSGKTMLISSYIASRDIPCLWYKIDSADSDIATFFYYLGLAIKRENPNKQEPMPLLTAEYIGGIGAFTRSFFELLSDRLIIKHPKSLGYGVLVFDNYNELTESSPLHDTIIQGLQVINDKIRVIIISRTDPPPHFAVLRAKNLVDFIGWEEIRFTQSESKEVVNKNLSKRLNDSVIQQIHHTAQGWAAGIVLMAERARFKRYDSESLEDFTLDTVFDYFGREIFNSMPPETQQFLLKTSLLPIVNIQLSERLTGINNAYKILSELNRNNFFTQRLSDSSQGYQYHHLFRDFLLNRLKDTFSHEELITLKKDAGFLLEQSGYIEEAVSLYSEAKDMDSLIRILINKAPEIIRQGRNKTIDEWTSRIPLEIASNNPWVLYWRGLCAVPTDMPRARQDLKLALEKFKSIGDVEGLYRSWAGIVDTYALELHEWRSLDDCIEGFFKLKKSYPNFPTETVELIASSRMLISLALRKTNNPRLVERWLRRVTDLLRENPSFEIQMDTIFYITVYFLWKGYYNRIALILEGAEEDILRNEHSPFAVIRIRFMKGIYQWVTGQLEGATKTFNEVLEISQKSGVRLFDFLSWNFKAEIAIASNNRELLEESLNSMKALLPNAKTLGKYFYHMTCAWHALMTEKPSLAEEHLQEIQPLAEKMDTPYYIALWHIGMAYTVFSSGSIKDAKRHIKESLRISLEMKSFVLEWFSLLALSYFYLKEGSEEEGLKALTKGLSLGKKHAYCLLEFYQSEVMQTLLAKAIDKGIEREYVTGLIRKLHLPQPNIEQALIIGDNWPYPLKIYTLGRFAIFRDDRLLTFHGKAQQKPMELIKAIIAFGGKDIAYSKLMEALWPDAEGDKSSQTLKFTLHALRKVLLGDRYILLKDTRLSINPDYCFIDMWQVLGLLKSLDSLPASCPEIEVICKQIMSYYKGHFLSGDEAYSWSILMRERLRSGVIRAFSLLCSYYEDIGNYDNVLDYCHKALEIDSLQEDFYRRMIACYIKSGRHSEALITYKRCKDILLSELGIAPSVLTENLIKKIRQI